MSASKLPGPLCICFRAFEIDSGTLCRSSSPIPRVVERPKALPHKQPTAAVPSDATSAPSNPIPAKLRVAAGQVTFDAEGNDTPGSLYFSRVVHWPGNSKSGVTIGRVGNGDSNGSGIGRMIGGMVRPRGL